jgi:predicted lysophospholipase L1 biosynthesis ABC-type transport system permease subunit
MLGPADAPADRRQTLRIVGVARDAHYDDLRAPPAATFYVPLAQYGEANRLVLSVRTSGNPAGLAALVRREIDRIAPGIRIRRLAGFEEAVNEMLTRERLAAALATVFGVLALALAAIGLYGVVAYNVGRRTQEIGVRIALGAKPGDVLRMVVRQSLALTSIGVVVGVPLAAGAARAVATQLYGIDATDPRVMLAAAAIMCVVGIAASAAPARRAARVDPVEALRNE